MLRDGVQREGVERRLVHSPNTLAPKRAEALGEQVVVEYRPGAGGQIGFESARALNSVRTELKK